MRVLGPSRAIALREHIRPTGRLDYPEAEIHMVLDSYQQVARLQACTKEPETVAWIRAHMRAGDVFYDIGANVGAYSFVAHAVAAGRCLVYAFEPSFSTFAALSENVGLNRCQQKILPFNIALTDETGLIQLNLSSVGPGAALHSLGAAVNEFGEPFAPQFVQPVLGYRLDDIIEQFGFPHPNLIKLDVDGSELNVLTGAQKVLQTPNLRTLLVEINEQLEDSKHLIDKLSMSGLKFRSKYARSASNMFNYVFERTA